MTKIYIAKSQINGTGVFAGMNVGAGEMVIRIDDTRIVSDERPLKPGELSQHCDYLAEGKVILMQEPERYINHCCDPNSYVKTVDGYRYVIALGEILQGAEITNDYCINGYGDYVWYCYCGSTNCRKRIISGFFLLPLEVQLKYLALLDAWFVKEHRQEVNNLMKISAMRVEESRQDAS